MAGKAHVYQSASSITVHLEVNAKCHQRRIFAGRKLYNRFFRCHLPRELRVRPSVGDKFPILIQMEVANDSQGQFIALERFCLRL